MAASGVENEKVPAKKHASYTSRTDTNWNIGMQIEVECEAR
jgi:hypothetical protein